MLSSHGQGAGPGAAAMFAGPRLGAELFCGGVHGVQSSYFNFDGSSIGAVVFTIGSFANPSHSPKLSFAPHPPGDEVIDLSVGMLDCVRWHADDRLRRWIHQHRFSVTDLALIRRVCMLSTGARLKTTSLANRAVSYAK